MSFVLTIGSTLEMNLFKINSKELFSEESGKKNVSGLNIHFEIVDDKSSIKNDRDALSPLSLEEAYDKSDSANKHFTEFLIEGVYDEDLRALLDKKDELREIIPLNPNKKDPELKKLSDGDRKKILKALNNKKFCPTIEFYYSINKGIYEKWEKYFPQRITSKNSKVYTGTTDNFTYYVISAGKNIGERHSLTLRSKNILIKANTVLEQPGPNQVCDSVIKKRIYGEILHINMKQFIEVTRNEFIKNKDYNEFREALVEEIGEICHELRGSYNKGQGILNYVYDPFVSIRDEDEESPLKKIQQQVEQLAGSTESQKIMQRARELFSGMSDTKLEKAPNVSDYLKEKGTVDVESEDYILRIQSDIDEAKTEKDHKKDKTIVIIPVSTYDSMEIEWFGEIFTVRFVYVESEGKPYSVDFDNRRLTIDTFYHDFKKYGLNFLEVILTLDLSFKSVPSDDPECDLDEIRKCLELYKDSVITMPRRF